MKNKLLDPLIIVLLIIKIELYHLESIMDNNSTDNWPPGYYENILLTTDKFYRTRNKLLKFLTEDEIDYLLYNFERFGGNA